MTGTYTIPSKTHVPSDTGHALDHDNIATVLAGMPVVLFNVLNTAWAGGADPTGAADSTAAFQATLNAIAASATGGVLYIPAGKYQITSGLTYSASVPLTVKGDGPQASQIRLNSTSTSLTYLSVTMTGTFGDQTGVEGACYISDLSFYNDHLSGAFSNTNVAIGLNSVNLGAVINCGFYKGGASQRVNQAIVLNACNQVIIDGCDIWAAVNGIAFTGFCQVNTVRDTHVWTPNGTGVATAAAVLYQGQTLGTNMKHVVLHDGDRGILWTQDAGTHQPHLFEGLHVEFNNHHIAAAEFDYGVHVWLVNNIFSGAAVAANVPGLLFGPNFQGDAIVDGCEFIGQPGRAVDIEAGTGFTFNGCVFGGSGTYKAAANTYDEIFINSGVAEVSINACHFNVNANAGLGSVNPPRSAVWVTSGATEVTVTSSKGRNTGYGTSAVVDNANAVMKRGNIGLGLADSTTGSGATVTTATFANLGASVSIPANDLVVGKVYKMTVKGTGTQATGTAQNLTVRMTLGRASLGAFTAQTNPAAGASFAFTYECLLYVTAAGVNGSVTPFETWLWGGNGNAAAAATVHHNAGQTVNTTVANAMVLTAQWAAATGSPTITGAVTTLEPVQNWSAS